VEYVRRIEVHIQAIQAIRVFQLRQGVVDHRFYYRSFSIFCNSLAILSFANSLKVEANLRIN